MLWLVSGHISTSFGPSGYDSAWMRSRTSICSTGHLCGSHYQKWFQLPLLRRRLEEPSRMDSWMVMLKSSEKFAKKVLSCSFRLDCLYKSLGKSMIPRDVRQCTWKRLLEVDFSCFNETVTSTRPCFLSFMDGRHLCFGVSYETQIWLNHFIAW